jgi:hypothetical protein
MSGPSEMKSSQSLLATPPPFASPAQVITFAAAVALMIACGLIWHHSPIALRDFVCAPKYAIERSTGQRCEPNFNPIYQRF